MPAFQPPFVAAFQPPFVAAFQPPFVAAFRPEVGAAFRPEVVLAIAAGQQPQEPPQQPPPPLGAEGMGAPPPRPVTATVDSSLTVSAWPCGHSVGADASRIGRLTSKVSQQARQRNS